MPRRTQLHTWCNLAVLANGNRRNIEEDAVVVDERAVANRNVPPIVDSEWPTNHDAVTHLAKQILQCLSRVLGVGIVSLVEKLLVEHGMREVLREHRPFNLIQLSGQHAVKLLATALALLPGKLLPFPHAYLSRWRTIVSDERSSPSDLSDTTISTAN